MIGSNPAAVISAMNRALSARTCLSTKSRADARAAVKLDHDQPASEAERAVDRGEDALGLLQMVIRVAQERHVDTPLGQIDRVLRPLDDLDLRQAALFARSAMCLRNGGETSTA